MKKVIILLLCLTSYGFTYAQCDHPDYEGLMQLFHATDGERWFDNTGWVEGAEGTDCAPCENEWLGVFCENNRVISITLFNNNLKGTLPDLKLDTLIEINLSSNQLEGSVPDFSYLSELQELHLNNNAFSGHLPDFKNLRKLTYLNLSLNSIEGELVDFSNMDSLSIMQLTSNQITGPLIEYSALPNLTQLLLGNNMLEGPIPYYSQTPNLILMDLGLNGIIDTVPNFKDLPNLFYFYAYSNELYGKVPDFSHCPELIYLYLVDNNISEVPDTFAHENLCYIWLDNNQIDGCYPVFEVCTAGFMSFLGNEKMPYFGNYPLYVEDSLKIDVPCQLPGMEKYVAYVDENCECKLDTCDVYHPDLAALVAIYESTGGDDWIDNTGWKAAANGARCNPCSEKFGTFYGVTCENDRVVCIDLDGDPTCSFTGFSGNNLTGTWPSVSLQELRFLILDGNEIGGDLPDVSRMPQLKELRLGHNAFTGKLPNSYDNVHLTTVRLSYNQLSGNIPSEPLTDSLNFFTVANNNLSGCFPDWVCDLRLFSSNENPQMPWHGDYEKYCNGETQILAPCGFAFQNNVIQADCSCCAIAITTPSQVICPQVLYPNPADREIYISNLEEGTLCDIINMEGRLVMSQNLNQGKIDVTHLSNGVYFLQYVDEHFKTQTQKFLKVE